MLHETKDAVQQLYKRVLDAQSNVKRVLENIDVWKNQLLFERKEGKKENLLQLDDHDERIRKRYEQVGQSAKEMSLMLQNNYKLYSNIPIVEVVPPIDEQV